MYPVEAVRQQAGTRVIDKVVWVNSGEVPIFKIGIGLNLNTALLPIRVIEAALIEGVSNAAITHLLHTLADS